MKVYCQNCSHENATNCHTQITFNYKGNTFIFGDYGCGRESVGVAIDDTSLQKVVCRNEYNNCPSYIRKWWKFWIKEEVTNVRSQTDV